MEFGTTFSHPYLKALGINPLEAIKALTELPLTWIRLACYMDDPDWEEMETYLAICHQQGKKVVMTIGQKAPRWPEFYLPPNLLNIDQQQRNLEILKFISTAINKFSSHSCLKMWQIENEPLDPSGPHYQKIDSQFLKLEIDTLKQIDNRPIMATFWGNELINRNLISLISEYVDYIGLDMYFAVPGRFNRVHGLRHSIPKIKQYLKKINKPIWITELQAEPWGKVTIEPRQITENVATVLPLNPEAILLWGFEYWYQERIRGNHSFWNTINSFYY